MHRWRKAGQGGQGGRAAGGGSPLARGGPSHRARPGPFPRGFSWPGPGPRGTTRAAPPLASAQPRGSPPPSSLRHAPPMAARARMRVTWLPHPSRLAGRASGLGRRSRWARSREPRGKSPRARSRPEPAALVPPLARSLRSRAGPGRACGECGAREVRRGVQHGWEGRGGGGGASRRLGRLRRRRDAPFRGRLCAVIKTSLEPARGPDAGWAAGRTRHDRSRCPRRPRGRGSAATPGRPPRVWWGATRAAVLGPQDAAARRRGGAGAGACRRREARVRASSGLSQRWLAGGGGGRAAWVAFLRAAGPHARE